MQGVLIQAWLTTVHGHFPSGFSTYSPAAQEKESMGTCEYSNLRARELGCIFLQALSQWDTAPSEFIISSSKSSDKSWEALIFQLEHTEVLAFNQQYKM